LKTVLITGGSRGIGAATAALFSKNGYRVIINYNKSEKEALELAEKIGGLAIKADISDYVQVQKMFESAGNVDILINNAGIAQQKLFTDISFEEWHRMLDVNLSGVFYCCKCALPYMINQKAGCIINISSMWGICGASCEVHYSAAKSGVIGLTKALAKEVGPSGITVNCIAPGMIDTEMNSMLDDETKALVMEETPLGITGTVEDIAQCALYLAQNGRFITGQVLSPNGGLVI